ncbi:hypothetical protein F5J12DRAFT_785383 [Pisolithus orientalis]|uniref:uncharacterized protein n=1 Tax=Pisolithus orientalis TaxID=936130 RepID=UPI0022240DA8|nr:uncharacterized protein F5J12DRAFT_785383 [Pisolithus orientalis]KAI5996599.1 hypothetical protein F5J12DRAFT_785383 [Pisolithus orientalis]
MWTMGWMIGFTTMWARTRKTKRSHMHSGDSSSHEVKGNIQGSTPTYLVDKVKDKSCGHGCRHVLLLAVCNIHLYCFSSLPLGHTSGPRQVVCDPAIPAVC